MKLIFVYNADSGIMNSVLDSMQKVISPESYDCNLCAITYGIVSENELWKNFRRNEAYEMDFLHRDEFERQYRSKWLPKYTYPIILTEGDESFEIFLNTEEVNELKSSTELIESIKKRSENY